MSFSPARALVFFVIGLPIGFILSALGFTILSRDISAPAIAPWALVIAAIGGIGAGLRKEQA
ncbi:hypothetical protein SAMN06297468_0061 [Altererythrobacter xiamenensis]|uniref:Uncharacterized protein n=1 Tax=Altererythrobacter xiamenensis TaxID=1316679 RepID=A0A1Y6E5B0_9SPHN|nr:hypothetical protein [Altererythrobacter xiamenensis]SMQ57829.1 hypothetical protein SAMN06297468_0061 [Altererythrobacter xiamenensis]